MPVGSGLGGQLGFAEETVYGTRVTPNKFLYFNSEGIQQNVEYTESSALGGSNFVMLASRSVRFRKGATGPVELEMQNKGMGVLLRHMHGTASAPLTPAGGTLARFYRFNLGDLFTRSLTVQVGRPSTDGVVRPFDYVGGKITEWSLRTEVDGVAILSPTFDFQDEQTNQTLATPTFATGLQLFHWAGASLTLGGTLTVGTSTALTSVATGAATPIMNLEINRSNGLKTDRYLIRGNTLKREPIQNEIGGLSGSFDAEFDDMTNYNRFVNGTVGVLQARWVCDTLIEGAIPFELRMTFPAVRFEGETPNVGGPDVLTHSLPWTALDDGVNGAVITEYVTTDTAL